MGMVGWSGVDTATRLKEIRNLQRVLLKLCPYKDNFLFLPSGQPEAHPPPVPILLHKRLFFSRTQWSLSSTSGTL